MSELRNAFRFYDFLAYLFPGIATLHAISLCYGGKSGEQTWAQLSTTDPYLNLVLFIILAYSIGHVWSYIGRIVIRTMLLAKWRHPREDILDPNKSSLGPIVTIKVLKKVASTFHMVNSKENAVPIYRLARTYALQNCPDSSGRQEVFQTLRVMCLNMSGPSLMYFFIFLLNGLWIFAIVALFGAVLLFYKFMDLRDRELREIYLSFLLK